MSSLKERIELLESDLKAVPLRISVYHDLPFAILRYDPTDEWDLRREVKLLATRLEAIGKEVHEIRMSELLWRAIDETEGLDEVVGLERSRGYLAAQDQVTTYLSDRDWRPLAGLLVRAARKLRPIEEHRLPDPCGGDGTRHLSHVETARPDAGQNPRDDDSVLSRLHRRHNRPAVHEPEGSGRAGQLPSQDLRLTKVQSMKTIGDLLTRDLSRKIEEIIQVDQADEQSVHDEITEYVATDSIREQYHQLFRAIADAPSEPHESIGVWISGFFGSGKSSFAKYLGYALQNKTFLGKHFADLFKQQIEDERISNLLDLINAKTPTGVILFEVAKERDTRKVTERIAELMYTVLLRELDYAEDFDIAELEIELEAEGKLDAVRQQPARSYTRQEWRMVRKARQKLSRASACSSLSSTRRLSRRRIRGRIHRGTGMPLSP